jgi:hypothetical protein
MKISGRKKEKKKRKNRTWNEKNQLKKKRMVKKS